MELYIDILTVREDVTSRRKRKKKNEGEKNDED